ncbi:MAG: hypothetical protein Q9186_007571 [Xanthomendoza sp. 1 TL-2023]
MSRRVYVDEIEGQARLRAREAKLAQNAADDDSNLNQHQTQDELMEIIEQGKSIAGKAWETALVPFHAAVSKPAQKAYLGTFLFASASLFLLGLSTIAYALFYYNFVPQVSVERTIYLQFGDGHPYGTATLDSSLTSLQPYDVSLLLHLPRTPSNQAAGNFMLDLSLQSPLPRTLSSTDKLLPEVALTRRLAHSRRPAILTYSSPIIDTASTLTGLPFYVLGWKTESEVVEVNMFEGVEFAKGWATVPQEVKLVVEADEKMQFYEVGIRIFAKFGGLRWIMYHHRILSYVIFTSMFWSSSMISTLIAWIVLSSYLSTGSTAVKEEPTSPKIKAEPSEAEKYEPSLMEGLSDTSRTFPTLGRHKPLTFTGREGGAHRGGDAQVKQEDEVLESTGVQPLIAEADDEDDTIGTSAFRDSGIGTSLDEGQRARVQRRKKNATISGLAN